MHKITPTCLPERNSKKQPAVTLVKLAAAMAATFAFQTAYANCTATMSSVNFGDVDPLSSGTHTTKADLVVTCNKTHGFFSRSFTNVCLAIDGGVTRGDRQMNPRRLCAGGSCTAPFLYYNLYTDSSYNKIWGTSNISGDIYDMFNAELEFPTWSNSSLSRTFTVEAKLTEPLAEVKPGAYSVNFSTGSTAMGFEVSDSTMPASCGRINKPIRFDFTVTANIIKNCIVSKPSDIDFGDVSPSETNLQGQTSFNVRCTKDTPYTIGMKPSNENLNGAGFMEPRWPGTGNSDKIPYQLRSQSGINGTIWGNTATATSTGNGVSGTGTGFDHEHTVYATVPSADYHVGEYQDTVTIQVNY